MSKLLVIPSIDIKNGKTVRVVQGIPELHCDEYGNDPIEMAMLWRAENAKCIHVVDFNSSREHSHKNYKIIEEICDSVIIPVQLGGGIRTFDDVKSAFDMGIYRVVIGTMAYENPKEFQRVMDNFSPNKIVAAIDVVDGEIMVNGRTKKTGLDPVEYAKKLSDMGVARIIVTDVKRNGMMTGPNIELSKRIGDVTGIKITLSGGIGGYKDLISVQDCPSKEIDSVIIGRALYENKFPCQKIWRVAEAGIFN
jgi:phosphoribosylformimino-5-aminoimidazole carboxamide ribotide isomerase